VPACPGLAATCRIERKAHVRLGPGDRLPGVRGCPSTRARSRKLICRATWMSLCSASTGAARGAAGSSSAGCWSSLPATIRCATATSSASGPGRSRRPGQRDAGIRRAWSGRKPSARGEPLTWTTPVKWRPATGQYATRLSRFLHGHHPRRIDMCVLQRISYQRRKRSRYSYGQLRPDRGTCCSAVPLMAGADLDAPGSRTVPSAVERLPMTAVLPRRPDLPGTSPQPGSEGHAALRQSSQKWGSDRQRQIRFVTPLTVAVHNRGPLPRCRTDPS